MKTSRLRCLDSKGFHRMCYYDWGGAADRPVVICVHGLTRSGRDFDFLAGELSRSCRVICPDVVGRGQSDWLQAKSDYNYVQYLNDMTALIARVTQDGEPVFWVGTSMGALIGIVLASLPGTPIGRLVVNDAGPLVPKSALQRIADYVGKDPRFGSYDEVEAYVRRVSAPFGSLSDEQWRHLTVHSTRQFDDGRWGMAYDPAIGLALQGPLEDVNLWAQWDAIRCPTLVLRGVHSDVLLAETAQEMVTRGPKPRIVEIADVGHAPMLMTDEQARVVSDFLAA